MSNVQQVLLTDDEIKAIYAILKFAVDACPIEGLPDEKIDVDTVENLIGKFEALKAK